MKNVDQNTFCERNFTHLLCGLFGYWPIFFYYVRMHLQHSVTHSLSFIQYTICALWDKEFLGSSHTRVFMYSYCYYYSRIEEEHVLCFVWQYAFFQKCYLCLLLLSSAFYFPSTVFFWPLENKMTAFRFQIDVN